MTDDGESVGEAAQRLDGCLPENSAEDVLDVMDAPAMPNGPSCRPFERIHRSSRSLMPQSRTTRGWWWIFRVGCTASTNFRN